MPPPAAETYHSRRASIFFTCALYYVSVLRCALTLGLFRACLGKMIVMLIGEHRFLKAKWIQEWTKYNKTRQDKTRQDKSHLFHLLRLLLSKVRRLANVLLQGNGTLFELSLCLSRACLGKMIIIYSFKTAPQKYRFFLTLRLYSTGPFRNSGSHSSGSGHATGRVIFPPAA